MSENDKQNPADLAGVYALDALTPAETAEFERYLAQSEEARSEAAELGDTAVALGLATRPVQPSTALKAELMARLASTPQLPAVTAPAAPPGPAERRAQLRWFQRPAVLAGSLAAALALFFGGLFVGQAINTTEFEQQQAAALADINAAPDAQRASTVTVEGQPATLVWSGELGLSALLIEDLPPLPQGKDYQLWYMNPDGAFPAGTFDSPGDGTVWRVLEGTMRAGDQVGVTVEPDGGSPEPTTDPILAIQS